MRLYMNDVATTSRAVLAFVAHTDLDVECVSVDLQQGEHFGPAFTAVNPNRLIPVLVDDDFVLTESSAILKYLARKTDSALYPTNLRGQARVDEAMAWFEANLYKDLGFQFVYPALFPHHSRGSEQADAATVAFGRTRALERLAVLDAHTLGDGRAFLTGDRLTIADLHGASILSLGELVGLSLAELPNVEAWYRRVCALPCWHTTHAPFRGFVAAMQGAASRVSA